MDAPIISKRVYRFGLFEVDVESGKLLRQGTRVKLQDQPFRLLCLLLERAGQVVTREELRQALWSSDTYVEFDGSLNATLKRLRFALGDPADNPIFIETLPKRGYRFLVPVTVEEPVSSTASAAQSVLTDTTPARHDPSTGELARIATADPGRMHWRHSLTFGIAIVLLAVVGVASYHRLTSADESKSVPGAQPQVVPRVSVAVIGFNNASGRAEDAWLSTAFSEMLSTELAAGEKLRLVSGEDVVNLRLSSPWPQTDTLAPQTTARIGTALNSDLLVLGSYTNAGKPESGPLRLDVRLQDARTGRIVVEAAETGSSQNLFDLISRIGAKLRNRLGVPGITDTEEPNVLASLPSNPEAARLYSRGLVKLREYDYLAARGLFEETIKADPKFALAHSMLSRADIFLGHDDQAKAEAKRGLDLAGGLSRVRRMEIEASYYHANAERARAADIYRVLFNLFPDSLDYGLQLAKLELESYHPEQALETVHQLRQLPAPARDDPGIDLREGGILFPKDPQTVDRLWHSAAEKAAAQGRKLIYARAEENLCYINRQHLQSPPECWEAYEIYLAAGNRTEAGSCLQLIAEANRLTGHEVEAVPLYERALRMFREAGSREMIGVTLNNLSLVLANEGQWDRAEQAYREARRNFEAVNDWANTSGAMANIADIEVLRGHLKEAAEMYLKAWELADSSGRARHEYAHFQYSSLLLMQGNLKRARSEVEPQIISLRAYGGDPWELASALSILGDIQKAEGNMDGARKNYQETLEILKKANSQIATTQVSLAELSIAEAHPEAAEPFLREAIAGFEKDKSAGQEFGGYLSLSRALLAQGKVAEAQNALAHTYELADLAAFPVLNLQLQLVQARVTAATGTPDASARNRQTASRVLRAVIQKSQQLGLYNTSCEARLALGELGMKLNPASGRAQLLSLASETRSRGLELLARQAEQAVAPAALVVIAAGEPAR
jgi:DNA-binding winged helix-turn-helix (wHTH) protein/tetratricopeptide (TPR) repeat protein/TolB-like protein